MVIKYQTTKQRKWKKNIDTEDNNSFSNDHYGPIALQVNEIQSTRGVFL